MPEDKKLFSRHYLKQLKEAHKENSWNSGKSWEHYFMKFAKHHNVKSMLDYGCGKGNSSEVAKKHKLQWTGYDPGVDEFSQLPTGKFDLVLCTDVLEHIEPHCLNDVLDHIYGLTGKVAFFNISTSASKAILPDGRNAHLIIKDDAWWQRRVMNRNPWRSARKYIMKGVVLELRK